MIDVHALMTGDRAEDAVEGTHAQGTVSRYRDPVVRGVVRLQDNVTAALVHAVVIPVAAQGLDQGFAAEITRKPHPNAITSSRTKCKRMEWG